MARSINEIKAPILTSISTDTDISGKLSSPSKTGIYRLMVYIYAVCVNLFEQAMDYFAENNTVAVTQKNQFGSKWLRDKVFKYQHGDNPVLNTDTFEVEYTTVDTTLQIVTFCSVFNKYALNGAFLGTSNLYIRASKGATPTVLSGAEITGLYNYVKELLPPGLIFEVQSNGVDEVFIRADVRYDPRYSSTVQAATFASLLTYISDLEDGRFTVDGLFQAINEVSGVKEVIMEQVAIYPFGGGSLTLFSTFPGSTTSISPTTQYYYALAGVMVERATVGQTWSDTIQFTPIA